MRPQKSAPHYSSVMFQSTHPQGVRRGAGSKAQVNGAVSIHAPAGGATRSSPISSWLTRLVSIHAPAGGATSMPTPSPFSSRPFQSTHPQGVRLPKLFIAAVSPMFQSTHPQGVRLDFIFLGLSAALFQSTHPQGVRLWRQKLLSVSRCRFNPRTRRGCDSSGWWWRFWTKVSIHAPAGGATIIGNMVIAIFIKFQSTHPQGVRLSRDEQWRASLSVSIHAPAGGAT